MKPTRTRFGLLACCLALTLARFAGAESEVFDGDPADPSSGDAYEILPGYPLIQAGPDGIWGTADDVVDPSVVGDADLVVRAGMPASGPAIPPPAAIGGRGALPVGVAGPADGGGVEIPFTAYLCGASCYGDDPAAPYGYTLQTLDMDDFPVMVAAFADLDGDGFIGPTPAGAASSTGAISVQLQELEPVGRAVAHFDDGVAQGMLAIRTGLPSSRGGLRIALVAAASSGPFNPGTYHGIIGSGPAIATALPFLPQKDFTRFLRATAQPAGPDTTVYPLIQFASLPTAGASPSFALPLDGSSGTIDAAVVYSQAATSVDFRDDPGPLDMRSAASEVVLGTRGSARRHRLRVVPVDRLGNLADPPPGFVARLATTSPARLAGAPANGLVLSSSDGKQITLRVKGAAPSGTTGVTTIEAGGVVVAAQSYRIDDRANLAMPDATVPSRSFATIQAAIDGAKDVNHDGRIVIGLAPGVFHERAIVDRAVVLQGAGPDRTILQGDGVGAQVAITAAGATVRGLTAASAFTGIAIEAPSVTLADCRGWHDWFGVEIDAPSANLWRTGAIDNTADGLVAQNADALSFERGRTVLNGGNGMRIEGGSGTSVSASAIAANTLSGVLVTDAAAASASDNHAILNLGAGIETARSQANQIVGNLSATNDGDGLHMDTPGGDAVWQNVLDNNGSFGVWLSPTWAADFAAAPGTQVPIGDNRAVGNQEGRVND